MEEPRLRLAGFFHALLRPPEQRTHGQRAARRACGWGVGFLSRWKPFRVGMARSPHPRRAHRERSWSKPSIRPLSSTLGMYGNAPKGAYWERRRVVQLPPKIFMTHKQPTRRTHV